MKVDTNTSSPRHFWTSKLQETGIDVVQGDALKSEALQLAIEQAKINGDGQISGAAHLVGSILLKPPHALKVEDFEEVITTNLTSAFLAISNL